MNAERPFFASPAGQLALVGALLLVGAGWIAWRHHRSETRPIATVRSAAPLALPKTYVREGTRMPKPTGVAGGTPIAAAKLPATVQTPAAPKPVILPLALSWPAETPARKPAPLAAPFGRLIPCETVVALESNRLETPVIGLVTEDVWHDGRRIIPAGAEVHGKAALDRTRERLAAEGRWHIVWRTPDNENGTDLTVTALALDRDREDGKWGEHDGSAGLRGVVIKTGDDRELKLFAATFLGSATAALQETQATTGLLGTVALPATTAGNATLAGLSAIMREYAQSMRDAIARDGFYLRVPAGKPFYLYVTQPIERPAPLP
jgi:hypothetical protein